MKSLPGFLLLALATASPVAAQTMSIEQAKAVSQATSPSADLRTGTAGSGFVISADNGSSEASVSITRSWNSGAPQNNLSIKVSTPLNKDTGEGSFLTTGGLGNGTSVQIGFTRIMPWRDDPVKKASAVRAYGIAACAGQAPTDDDKKACAAKSDSDLQTASFFSAKDARLAATDAAFLNGPVWSWGVSAGVGYSHFDYKDPTDFSDQSQTRTPYNLSLTFGVLPKQALTYAGAGYEFKQEYDDARSRTLCKAPPATGAQECFTSPFARPDGQRTSDLFAVMRTQTQLGSGDWSVPLGIEVKGAYDFEQKIYGVTSSIYFVADAKNNLIGGLRLRWQSDDKDPTTKDQNFFAGAFVGAAFSVF